MLRFVSALIFCLVASVASAVTYEVVAAGTCRALAYSSQHKQTDHDPFSTAAGTTPKWGTVAANHFPLWTRLKISGFGEKIFTVEDRMNKRYTKTIDLWFPSKQEARHYGVKRVRYWVLKNVKPLPN